MNLVRMISNGYDTIVATVPAPAPLMKCSMVRIPSGVYVSLVNASNDANCEQEIIFKPNT